MNLKRVGLFLMTNIAVLATLSTVAHLFGFNQFVTAAGLDFGALLGFAALFGFGGAFISLAMSKWVAMKSVGARVIEAPANDLELWLVATVRRQAQAAGIGMPDVALYDADEVNAFATGMKRNHALVAVSTGLLRRMTRDEAEAVLAHEVSHIANGDMVTLALIQGVVNTFVIVIARAVGYFVDRVILKNTEGLGVGYYATFIIMEIGLGILASLLVMHFSRQREFRADAGGASLAGRSKMIAALRRLQASHEPSALPERVAAFGISGNRAGGWRALFTTHPPLEARIAALEAAS